MRRCGTVAALAVLVLLASCGPKPSRESGTAGGGPKASVRFADITEASGIRFNRFNGGFGQRWMPEIMGGGGAFIDYDNDGWPDILLVNGDWWPGHKGSSERPRLSLYHNDRSGRFTDVTVQSGLGQPIQGMGVAVGDFDNDGWDDIFLSGVGDCRLYRNIQGQRFADVTPASGLSKAGWASSAAWLDYDNDGRLDLFVCHYLKWSPATDVRCGTGEKIYCRPQDYQGESCRLYHNLGGGRFHDVTAQSGIANDKAKALGVAVCDVDKDGYPDIVVANDMEPNFLFHNLRNGRFEETAATYGIAVDEQGHVRGGMGIDTSFNVNGAALHLAIGNFFQQGVSLYVLTAPGSMQDTSASSGVRSTTSPFVTFGLLFADFDNDGRDDLFLTNGHVYDNVQTMDPSETFRQPNQLFWNRGGGGFDDASAGAGPAVTTPIAGRAACVGDVDNNGAIDLLVVPNSGPALLLGNKTPSAGRWIGFQLAGVKSNGDGYGATIELKVGGRTVESYARSGSSYQSASDRRVHFGLGPAGSVDEVLVRWPSGLAESFGPKPAGAYYKLTEGEGKPVARRQPGSS